MQRADQAILDLRHVGAGHVRKTGLWRYGLPLEPSDAVMAERGADCTKFQTRRQVSEQVADGLRDALVSLHRMIGLVEPGVG